MKNFLKTVQQKDYKLSNFFEKKELESIEKSIKDLESQHQDIIANLKEVNYLLDLIEKHNIKKDNPIIENDTEEQRSGWLTKIKSTFENLHLLSTDKLSSEDIDYLENEVSKLKFEKEKLEKEHHLIHHLIAKAQNYLVEANNVICDEITKGYDIAAVGEKILEHFGKELKGDIFYNEGVKIIRKMLEDTFLINKIQSRVLFDILEKSKVVEYKIDTSDMIPLSNADEFAEFTNINYAPLFGSWYINF